MGLCTDRPGSLDTTENGDAGGHEPWQILFDPLANRLAGVECMGRRDYEPMLAAADDVVDRVGMDCAAPANVSKDREVELSSTVVENTALDS